MHTARLGGLGGLNQRVLFLLIFILHIFSSSFYLILLPIEFPDSDLNKEHFQMR